MPFTFAHPAAVLPLRRFRFLLTLPLAIGSLVPDVPYYFPMPLGRLLADTHSIWGSFVIGLPLGMTLLVAVLLLREPLTVLLGPRTRAICLRSVEHFTERPLHWPIALLSLLLGSWTHIAWDSFTHPDGWTTLRVAALQAPVSLFGWQTEVSHLLQYLSSVFGLAVVALWLRGMLAREPAPAGGDAIRDGPRHLLLTLAAAAGLLIGVTRAFTIWDGLSYYHLSYLLLTRTIGWFGALYLLTGVLITLNRRPQPEPAG
ncbi:MAG TPA: DUF4184 family protein [Steroidobacteraceae bacterium]|nr:DUF4184 family protein [Steroidobacteraceae bacterium]